MECGSDGTFQASQVGIHTLQRVQGIGISKSILSVTTTFLSDVDGCSLVLYSVCLVTVRFTLIKSANNKLQHKLNNYHCQQAKKEQSTYCDRADQESGFLMNRSIS